MLLEPSSGRGAVVLVNTNSFLAGPGFDELRVGMAHLLADEPPPAPAELPQGWFGSSLSRVPIRPIWHARRTRVETGINLADQSSG